MNYKSKLRELKVGEVIKEGDLAKSWCSSGSKKHHYYKTGFIGVTIGPNAEGTYFRLKSSEWSDSCQ